MKRTLFLAALFVSTLLNASEVSIKDFRVAGSVEPAAVEDARPVFSWKMESTERGQLQSAYRIVVRRAYDGATVWDSGKVADASSTGIKYLGTALQTGCGYDCELSVWDRSDELHSTATHFGMGLMNPKLSAWKGASFIGDNEPTLDAASLTLFGIQADFTIYKGTTAGFIFGADDFRLQNDFCNDFNLSGRNYFKLVLDLSGYGKSAGAKLLVYRVGYAPGDSAEKPLLTISKAEYPQTNINSIISKTGVGGRHSLKLYVSDGQIRFAIDGQPLLAEPWKETPAEDPAVPLNTASAFQISPLGNTHDFNLFPHLCSVGFLAMPQSDVVYTGYTITGGGRSYGRILFAGTEKIAAFKKLSYVRLPQYRDQKPYDNDIVVVNKSDSELLEWIDPSFGGARMLRSEFIAGKTIASAKLYATALGAYNFHINGEKVGEDWFAPGASQYREILGYHAYDVTGMLKTGRNAMGAELFPGWYSGYITPFSANFNFFGDEPALLCRLDLTYEDGTMESVVSDPAAWKTFDGGPVRYGTFFMGERYDARLEAAVKGWSMPGFNDLAWKPAQEIKLRDWVDPDIIARIDEPVRVREVLEAEEVMPVHSDDYHTYIYDMGINMVGVPEITIPAGYLNAGDVVVVRYAEQIYPGLEGDSDEYIARFGKNGRKLAGHMLFASNRAAMNTDFYIAAGSGEAVIRPRSTFRGYQYLQITLPSHEGPLPLQNIKGLVLSSCEMPTGSYKATTKDEWGTELVNQLFLNIQRSQLGNFITIPTDCPQRNERMGWTGDAQAYCRTATYQADMRNFFRQWMRLVRADQAVGGGGNVPGGVGVIIPEFNTARSTGFTDCTTWGAAVCMVPWQIYSQYGDTQIVEENIDAMFDWLSGMAFYPFNDKYPHLSARTGGLADWLAMDGRTPAELVNNAIYIHMMEVTAIMADAVGRSDYARILRERHGLAKAEWNAAYVDPATGRTRNIDGSPVDSQTSYATPLNFNVFSDENKLLAEAHLAQSAASGEHPFTITTGFSGTPNILPALSRAGYDDVAYRMFCCTDLPSWLYPVSMGATSIWERWDGYEAAFREQDSNTMNSFNHFALGSVGQWMFEHQLGITTDRQSGGAGYSHFVLQPTVGGDYLALEGSYESDHGRIVSKWTADGEGTMTSYSTVVPANSSATLYLPVTEDVQEFLEVESFATFMGTEMHNGHLCCVYSLASGSFDFTITPTSVEIH